MKMMYTKNGFVRHKEDDFSDDGNRFICYHYKDKLPITIGRYKGDHFISIRLDYLGFRWEDYKDDNGVLSEFNGVTVDENTMPKLVENCEYILKKYKLENPNDETNAKALCNAIRAFAQDERALENFELYLERHFGTWFSTWANTPEGLVSEFEIFAMNG